VVYSDSMRHWRLLVFACIGALAICAFILRWAQDDAYITYRYSRHLAEGLGPVWNPGERSVEGYTNFSWMMLVAAGLRLGLAADLSSHIGSVLCFAGSLALVYRIGKTLFRDERSALLGLLLVGTNFTFFMYATGGLETQLNAVLALGVLAIAVDAIARRGVTVGRCALLSLLSALAVMTRPDSVLVAAVGGATLITVALLERPPAKRVAVLAMALLLPAALFLVPWIWFKLDVYGSLLPNTYHVKLGASGRNTWKRGVAYVGLLFVSYWWIFIIAFLSFKAKKVIRQLGPEVLPLVAFAALWLAYVVHAGGDIMEFRQLVPAIPAVLLVMLLWTCTRWPQRLTPALLLSGALLCGSASHAALFPLYVRPRGIGTISQLRAAVDKTNPNNWRGIGERLGADLGGARDVTIAISPAGAVPYFSQTRAIDMLGLNDRWVARQGFVRKLCDVCAGHARLATIDYLRRERVNLLIAQPQTVPHGRAVKDPVRVVRAMFYEEPVDYGNFPANVRLLRVPLSDESDAVAVYLVPHPKVDALIASGRWLSQPLDLTVSAPSDTTHASAGD
jgi:arabinofuranosyltransferase